MTNENEDTATSPTPTRGPKPTKDLKPIKEPKPTILLSGLPEDVNKPMIKNFMADYGEVAKVMFKGGPGGFKIEGYAYVEFESQESVDKLLEIKTVTINKKEVEISEEAPPTSFTEKSDLVLSLSCPKEALKCFMCKKERFSNVYSYLTHLKGKRHHIVLKLFKAKSAAVLQLLRAESKLASDRAYDVEFMKKNHKSRPRCDYCDFELSCNPSKHMLTVEHKLVKQYMQPKCCATEFKNRWSYEGHLLSVAHLKTAYEKSEQSEFKKTGERLTMKKAIDTYKQCDADLKELKETYGELDLNEELPPFDNKPIGLNHIVKKINYYCVCCDQKFFANIDVVEPHCRSYNHYANMQEYVLELEKKHGEESEARKRKMEGADSKPPSKKQATEETSDTKGKTNITKKGATGTTPKKTQIAKKEEEEERAFKARDYDRDDDEEDEHEVDEEEYEMQEYEEEEDHEAQEEEDQEEVVEEEQEEVDDSEVQAMEDEEMETQEENDEDALVEEVAMEPEEEEEEEEQEEILEVEPPKPTKSPRGRGRGRGRGRARASRR